MVVERVHRWDVGVGCAVALVAMGVATRNPVFPLAGLVPLAYVVAGAATALPATYPLTVERSCEPSTPAPGDRVTVALSVHNAGESTLSDVRVVDGVPEALTVVEGSPRASLSLGADESATLEYEVVARRGDHGFDPALTRIRTLTGSKRRTDRVEATGATTLSCRVDAGEVPLARPTTRQVGVHGTDEGGSGIEFHSTREYRAGDPVSRIDWRRFAKTGALSTVEFRERRAARVVVVLDARAVSRATVGPGHPDAVERCAYAADRVAAALVAEGNQVGATALGVDAGAVAAAVTPGPDGRPWVVPGADAETRARVESVFAAARDAEGADGRAAGDGERLARSLRRRLDRDAQVVVCTPALDDAVPEMVRHLRGANHAVTLLSPDVTGAETPGGTLAGLARRLRLREVRAAGGRVVDWERDRPLAAALAGGDG